ncbi:cyun108 [Cyclophragma undans nucleopolyhedrovirus]|uniref:Cyun108 n=1 Tax=Cyclophragma undans nucleopolyhedrovirus TaxID=1906244 RepID=A0A288Q830_9ABAC|nr:cyun108 [Cyclophragma undans nucleopolyhedrovirus]AOT85566.1 cyun108 [Cyclophragma undans nucleopolyhedrovirus]
MTTAAAAAAAAAVELEEFVTDDSAEFQERLDRVAVIGTMMRRTLDTLRQLGQCTERDADTLCLSDDTAAWICGRLPACNFVSFRVHIDEFAHPNGALHHFGFEESLAQRYAHAARRYTYMNYSIFKDVVALKLVVYTAQLNMYADGMPYFIDGFGCTVLRTRVRTSAARSLNASLPPLEQYIEDANAELSTGGGDHDDDDDEFSSPPNA